MDNAYLVQKRREEPRVEQTKWVVEKRKYPAVE